MRPAQPAETRAAPASRVGNTTPSPAQPAGLGRQRVPGLTSSSSSSPTALCPSTGAQPTQPAGLRPPPSKAQEHSQQKEHSQAASPTSRKGELPHQLLKQAAHRLPQPLELRGAGLAAAARVAVAGLKARALRRQLLRRRAALHHRHGQAAVAQPLQGLRSRPQAGGRRVAHGRQLALWVLSRLQELPRLCHRPGRQLADGGSKQPRHVP